MTTSSEVKKKVKEKDSKKKEVKAGVGKSKKDEIIKAIGQMNVLELSNLVKELREEFGVEALATPIVAQASGTLEKEEKEEKTEFDVILSEMGSKKIQVIKEVRKLTSLGLKEAKDLVEQAPKPVREKVLKEEALKIKETLEAVGAKVEIK
jgi:large subunit ribosomal protein L7/L12